MTLAARVLERSEGTAGFSVVSRTSFPVRVSARSVIVGPARTAVSFCQRRAKPKGKPRAGRRRCSMCSS